MEIVLIYITMQLIFEITIQVNVLNVNKLIFYSIIIIGLYIVHINVGQKKPFHIVL